MGPCKDCKDRRFKCHSECGEYQTWAKRRSAELKAANKERMINAQVFDIISKGVEKVRKGL